MDLDGDGDLDLISGSIDFVDWYENYGNDEFSGPKTISNQAGNIESVYAEDLDNDGDMDVLMASKIYANLAWFENDGSGNFGDIKIIDGSGANGARVVRSADIDGDGDMDVICVVKNNGQVSWYENDGFGLFGFKQVIYSSMDIMSVDIADLDGDMDIVLASESTDGCLGLKMMGMVYLVFSK